MAKWMQHAVKHPGALHRALGVPEGEKIPAKKMAKAAKSSNPHMKQMVSLAKTFKKYRPHAEGGKIDGGAHKPHLGRARRAGGGPTPAVDRRIGETSGKDYSREDQFQDAMDDAFQRGSGSQRLSDLASKNFKYMKERGEDPYKVLKDPAMTGWPDERRGGRIRRKK